MVARSYIGCKRDNHAACGNISGVTSGVDALGMIMILIYTCLNANDNHYPYGGKSEKSLPYIPIQIFISFYIVGRYKYIYVINLYMYVCKSLI